VQRIILRDPILRREMAQKGFVVVPLLDEKSVASLRDDLSALREPGFPPSTIVGQSLTYHSTALDSDAGYRRSSFSIIRDAVAPRLGALLDDFAVVSAGIITKPPGTGGLSLHCDWTMTEDPGETTITVWCPLVDVDEGNGCLRVVPGSHRLVRQIGGPGIRSYHGPFLKELGDMAVSLPMRAGDAVIFETSLLHGSPINASAVPRHAIMISCLPKALRPVFYRYEDSTNGERFEMFDLSDGAFSERSAHDYFAGLVADKLIARMPNGNEVISNAGFRRRHALAWRWRRFFSGYEPHWLFRALPGFR
jgi:hypothetical protein